MVLVCYEIWNNIYKKVAIRNKLYLTNSYSLTINSMNKISKIAPTPIHINPLGMLLANIWYIPKPITIKPNHRNLSRTNFIISNSCCPVNRFFILVLTPDYDKKVLGCVSRAIELINYLKSP